MSARDHGPDGFLSHGFRPLFLAALVYAALSMLAWMAWLGLHAVDAVVLRPTIAVAPHLWHAHEMLYGYTLAVIAGFFLTAVPNWTGTPPVRGRTLAALCLVWVAGRTGMWFSAHLPAVLTAAADLAFVPFLSLLVLRPLLAKWSRRNLVFIPVLAALLAANVLVHLEWTGVSEDTLAMGHRLALDTILVLIVIIGGRVVPAFTGNALRAQGEENLPRSHGPIEGLTIASMILLAGVHTAMPDSPLTGLAAALAAALNAVRLAGWQGLRTLGQPIVWVLHLGYLWLVLGLAALAAANLSDLMVEATALHALTVGAVGTMTLGIMTRASLGHTGRPLRVAPAVAVAYALLSVTAALRVAGPAVAPGAYNEIMFLAGLGWIAVFGIVAVVYWPVLTGPPSKAA